MKLDKIPPTGGTTITYIYEWIDDNTQPTEEDDDDSLQKKEQIRKGLKNLNDIELRIFKSYIDNPCFAALSRKYNVSTPTVKKYIENLKEKILWKD